VHSLTNSLTDQSFASTANTFFDDHAEGKNDDESLIRQSNRKNGRYILYKYISRAVLNSLGPVVILALYIFIVVVYLARPATNGIIQARPLDANGVFYAWWLINIFVLDWAKSGIAGFEAAALGHPALAPVNARQLMWHADRAWGSLTGWVKVCALSGSYLSHKVTGRPRVWIGPSGLWFYLAFSSLLLYAAIPLSGLSMNQASTLRMSDRLINVRGVNQSTFDSRTTNSLAETVGAIWRQGRVTTPRGDTVLYAPQGTLNASDTYYDDAVQSTYANLLRNTSAPVNDTITVFSGPEVTERAYGRAWGFLSSMSCTLVPPYSGLTLLNVSSINNWTSVSGLDSNQVKQGGLNYWYGLYPVYSEAVETLGASYEYVMASNSDFPDGIASEFVNGSALPSVGITELVMWQSYNTANGNVGDQGFADLQTHPMVVSSKSNSDNLTYYGFAVSCVSVADVGTADISAETYTFSDFKPIPASRVPGLALGQGSLTQYPFIMSMHTVAFCAATSMFAGLVSEPDVVYCESSLSSTCSLWSSANSATNAVPMINQAWKSYQPPTISPERMTLALYKLFGEVAIAMMGLGPGNWTTYGADEGVALYGLEPTSDLVTGVVPYQAVLAFLVLWVLITVVPQLWPPFFLGRRWGEILDGFTMFRLGAEWREAVHKVKGVELGHELDAQSLAEVPGMIGDMNVGVAKTVGFIGLSRHPASSAPKKAYTYAGPEGI
jgi:hypothetical protein